MSKTNEQKFTTNPYFKGTNEEAKKQAEDYRIMTTWLVENPKSREYADYEIGGFKFLCPLVEVPEPLLKYDRQRKEARSNELNYDRYLDQFKDENGTIHLDRATEPYDKNKKY